VGAVAVAVAVAVAGYKVGRVPSALGWGFASPWVGLARRS
jgi:hypothetical protein